MADGGLLQSSSTKAGDVDDHNGSRLAVFERRNLMAKKTLGRELKQGYDSGYHQFLKP